MLIIHFLSLLAILCFSFSQSKHFNVVFGQCLSDKSSKLMQISGVLALIVTQWLLPQQAQVGVSYVSWLCGVSMWIVLTGMSLSYFHHKKSKARPKRR
ncbi:DUF3325 family protein [Parashewanella curva]|uniref:DUF3325 family protein n=1 Tax=Parashewanella curva TaxID=2338552 RepID=A0A3L8PZ69_9GAMM|nr:DUF3325 family protein [Parashewanella curva]RLV60766.1 DUF3325 family protein [Parashewanella curva]